MTGLTVTMLGCGSSGGVPFIGCDCPVCSSADPRNNRTRVSIFVEYGDKKLLIDTSPDMRQQVLRENIRHIDAVLYTHDHADHTGGIDDIRSFNWLSKQAIDAYADAKTLETLRRRFNYIFQPPPTEGIWYRGSLNALELPCQPIHRFEAHGVPVTAFQQKHGVGTSLGYRIGNFAYSTDVNGFSEEAFEALAGLEVWIVDCLRYTTSPTHADLPMTLGWIERVKPKLAILTHMSHEFDYDILSSQLPSGAIVGYDGLKISL